MRELITTEGYCPSDIQNELEHLTRYVVAVYTHGPTDGLYDYGLRNGLICTTAMGLEAVADMAAGNAAQATSGAAKSGAASKAADVAKSMNEGSKANLLNRLKSWVVEALAKITSFGTHVDEKVSGFVHDLTSKVTAADVAKTAKTVPPQTVTAAVNSVGSATQAINKISGSMDQVFTTAEGLEAAKKTTADALNGVSSPTTKFTAEVSGKHVNLKTAETKIADTSVSATKDAVSGSVENFGAKSRGLWSALKRFGTAIRSTVTRGMSWAASGFKLVSLPADSVTAKAIGGMNRVARGGGVKGFLVATACISFVTFLVNTVLKFIKTVLNSVSDLITRFVNDVCGTKQGDVASDGSAAPKGEQENSEGNTKESGTPST